MLKSRSGGVGASAPFEVDGLHFGPLVRNDNNFNINNRQLVNADYRRDDAFGVAGITDLGEAAPKIEMPDKLKPTRESPSRLIVDGPPEQLDALERQLKK